MTRARWRQKIDWGAINFAFALAMVIITAVAAYAYFTGSASARIEALEHRVSHLEERK